MDYLYAADNDVLTPSRWFEFGYERSPFMSLDHYDSFYDTQPTPSFLNDVYEPLQSTYSDRYDTLALSLSRRYSLQQNPFLIKKESLQLLDSLFISQENTVERVSSITLSVLEDEPMIPACVISEIRQCQEEEEQHDVSLSVVSVESSYLTSEVPQQQEEETDSHIKEIDLPAQESDDEWSMPEESDSGIETYSSSRIAPKRWSNDECKRLRDAVNRLGTTLHWHAIAAYVGNRTVSQCINKWKNDICKGEKKKRWTEEATIKLKRYVSIGLTDKEIQERMPDYTYIQIYQQTKKLKTNKAPWQAWEYEMLIKLKQSGAMSDTEIGRRLNNRHRDVVKNIWNHIRRERNLD